MILAAVAWLNPGNVPWLTAAELAVLAAVLALDSTSWAQTWLSEPLAAGLLAGVICGDAATGLAVGLPFQLLSIGSLPVGQTFLSEKVSSVIAGTGGVILSGHRLSLLGLQDPQSGLLGWVLVAVALFSIAGHWVIQAEQRLHFTWMLEGHRGLRSGNLKRFDRLQVRCLIATFLRGQGLCGLWLLVMVLVWLPFYDRLPLRLVTALGFLPLVTPAMAGGVLIERYGLRSCWRWVLVGLAAGVALKLGLG